MVSGKPVTGGDQARDQKVRKDLVWRASNKNGLGPAEIFGEVAWLFMSSPSHRGVSLGDLEWRVVPALQRRQFRLFRQDRLPIAYISWALASGEIIEQLLAGKKDRLGTADWCSGDTALLVDIVAPYGDASRFLMNMAGDPLLGGRQLFQTDRADHGRFVIVPVGI